MDFQTIDHHLSTLLQATKAPYSDGDFLEYVIEVGPFDMLKVQREGVLEAFLYWLTADTSIDPMIGRANGNYTSDTDPSRDFDFVHMLQRITDDWAALRAQMLGGSGYELNEETGFDQYSKLLKLEDIVPEVDSIIGMYRSKTNCIFSKNYDPSIL